MPQIFHPSTNTISRLTIFGAVFIIAFSGLGVGASAESLRLRHASARRARATRAV